MARPRRRGQRGRHGAELRPSTGSTETCNGADDDCDGQTDEGLGTVSCGQGVCARTVDRCVGGTAQTCVAGTPGAETCNGQDDDCNGAVDDGLGSIACGVGACARTVAACVGGTAQTCAPGAAGTESCNLVDDDCDGQVDEGLGTTTCGAGVCQRTVTTCVGGATQACVPGPSSAETCNGLDDDCDGTVDDGLGSTPCGVGACARLVQNCVAGVPQTCVPGPAGSESCNLVDDDCDGTVDEELGTLSCGTGVCARTVAACVGGASQTCSPGAAGTESCNNLDDDCDGATDETFPQQGQACSTGLPGVCAAGTQGCAVGALTCQQTTAAGAEVCNTGLDEDCDGTVDDPIVCGCNSGVDNDSDGSNQCLDCVETDGTIYPGAAERCNGRDDDCDGAIDEGLDGDGDGFTPCGTVSGGGVDVRRIDCNDANAFVFPLKTTDCGAAATPTVGNNVDDNCNGYVDESCSCRANRDQDGDGFNECLDCDDTSSAVRPGGTEVCDGLDNDCNKATVDNCGVSDPCGAKAGANYVPYPAGTDQCRPDLVCVTNVSDGKLTCGSFCNQTTGAGLNDSCAVGQGCQRNLLDSDNLHLCSVATTGSLTTGQTCSLSSQCRSGDCETADGTPSYCTDKCTHEAGCSANSTCYALKAPVTSGPFQIGSYYGAFCRLDARLTGLKAAGAPCAAGECAAGPDQCVTTGGVARCAEPCCQHADCAAGFSCSIAGPTADTGYNSSGGEDIVSIVPSCVPSLAATRVAGAACTANTQCRSGICDRNLSICVDVCCNSSSCANGTTCQPVAYRTAAGDVTTIRACVFSPVPQRVEQR